MLLQVYNSKRDIYGNCYWAVILSDYGKIINTGTIACNNIDTIDCRDNLHIEVVYHELPIREFNKKFKNSEYLGCKWDDIKNNL